VQLSLFAPYEYGYQFKVIIGNAQLSARKLPALHNGRGAQEVIFAELKSQTQMDYVPCYRRAANQTWLLSAIRAHNLKRELQMSADQLTSPKGRLTLTLIANPAVQTELLHRLRAAA
jgi:hypothetical protein